MAAFVPRFIELGWNIKSEYQREHERVRVASNSGFAPPIIHVCRESREEAKKFYQLMDFEATPLSNRTIDRVEGQNPPRLLEHYVFYNPQVDTVYLGQHSCVSTLVYLLRQRLEIPRLAIINRRGWQTCCGAKYKGDTMPTSLKPLQILHGLPPTSSGHSSFPG